MVRDFFRTPSVDADHKDILMSQALNLNQTRSRTKQNLQTLVNIDKGENTTKINMHYFEIVNTQDEEMLNDNEFLSIFKAEL